MYEGNQITAGASLGAAAAEEPEADGLRDRIKVLDSQVAQLEYAIGSMAQKLTPVLRPVLTEPNVCGEAATPGVVRSPAAEQIHQHGLRIYQAHRDLQSIEKRLSL